MSRRFSIEEKRLILQLPLGITVTQRCREFEIHRRTYYKWLGNQSLNAKEERQRKLSEKSLSRRTEDQQLLNALKAKRPNATPFERAKHLIETLSLPVTRGCLIAGISRRTWYRWHRIKYVSKKTHELRDYCSAMIYRAAKKWNVPAAYITAHVRIPPSDDARKEVMRDMVVKLGLSRRMVAQIFNRDVRRIRKSELGG